MSVATRRNFDTCLADELLDNLRSGDWFTELGVSGPRYRLNGNMNRFLVDGQVVNGEREFGPRELRHIHDVTACGNWARMGKNHCVIHDPSDHGMREWPLIWNKDRSQMFRLCPHLLEHPDPDDVDYWVASGDQGAVDHECCRKCFPGMPCVAQRRGRVYMSPPLPGFTGTPWRAVL